jgi:hypothetical protein
VTFTDDDLKRLRAIFIDKKPDCMSSEDLAKYLCALLARLEAVERYASNIRKGREGWFNPEYEAWRKVAGKCGQ